MKIFGNTFKDDLNQFLKNNALWICIALVVLIAATIIVIFVIKNRKKKPAIPSGSEWVTALGGKENIKEVSAMGSRLSVSLIDQNVLNKEVLTSLGVSNIMTMSNKVTLIIEDKAEKIANEISKAIN